MRLVEISQPKKTKIKTYAVKLKIPGTGAMQIVDTLVTALNPQMARKLVALQYNVAHVLIGQPREVKLR